MEGILQKAGLDESYLRCGEHYPFDQKTAKEMKDSGEKPRQIHNNCSGKHAGMLLTSRFLGEDLDRYFDKNHPHQQRVLETISIMCNYPSCSIPISLDGCGVPVHALPLERFAFGMAQFGTPKNLSKNYQKACEKVLQSVMTHPIYASGSQRIDYKLMKKYPGKILVKSGADGYFAGVLTESGLGFALKTNDGNSERRNIVLIELLHQLGLIKEDDLTSFADEHQILLYNCRKEVVGHSKPVFQLSSN